MRCITSVVAELSTSLTLLMFMGLSPALAEEPSGKSPVPPPKPAWKQRAEGIAEAAKADLPTKERANRILKALRDEITQPTKAEDPARWHSEFAPSEHIQLVALKALTELRDPVAVQGQLRAAEAQAPQSAPAKGEPDETAKTASGMVKRLQIAMCMMGEAEAVPKVMVLATGDPDGFVRLLAVRALGAAKDKRAIPALETALRDPYARPLVSFVVEGEPSICVVRREAASALMQLGVKVERPTFNEWRVVKEAKPKKADKN